MNDTIRRSKNGRVAWLMMFTAGRVSDITGICVNLQHKTEGDAENFDENGLTSGAWIQKLCRAEDRDGK